MGGNQVTPAKNKYGLLNVHIIYTLICVHTWQDKILKRKRERERERERKKEIDI